MGREGKAPIKLILFAIVILAAILFYFNYDSIMGKGKVDEKGGASANGQKDGQTKMTGDAGKGNVVEKGNENPPPKHADNPPEKVGPTGEEDQKAYDRYKQCMKSSDLEGARDALAIAWKGNFGAAAKEEMKRDMIAINQKLLFSLDETKDSKIHTVKGGDSFFTIAKEYSSKESVVEDKQIKFFNKLKSDNIHEGQRIRVLTGKFIIRVQKSKYLLTLMYNDTVVKEYQIATGKDNKTPVGTFKIMTRMEKPDWDKIDDATGRVVKIKYGDPQNVLGEIWMGFADPFRSFGIHGTNDDNAIGKMVTNGCVRMHNNDVVELYQMTSRGTAVVIVE